jgi:hypothetical protein
MSTKLPYYAYGERQGYITPSTNTFPRFVRNNAYKDKASDFLERNAFSLNSSQYNQLKTNYTKLSTLSQKNFENNNYLNPLPSFERRYKNELNPLLINQMTFNKYRLQQFSKDSSNNSNLSQGSSLPSNDFKSNKQTLISSNSMPLLNSFSNDNSSLLNPNKYLLDRNSKGELIRIPKVKPHQHEFNRESKDIPNYFQIVNEEKLQMFQKELEKQDTITLLSRNKNWITVTPRHKNRNKCLENVKVKNDETSLILPKWMIGKYPKALSPDNFKGVTYTSIRNGKTSRQLIDKNNLKKNDWFHNRSIFAIGDFRHNVLSEKDVNDYQKDLSLQPKRFFEWDDGKVYDPKKKKG